MGVEGHQNYFSKGEDFSSVDRDFQPRNCLAGQNVFCLPTARELTQNTLLTLLTSYP